MFGLNLVLFPYRVVPWTEYGVGLETIGRSKRIPPHVEGMKEMKDKWKPCWKIDCHTQQSKQLSEVHGRKRATRKDRVVIRTQVQLVKDVWATTASSLANRLLDMSTTGRPDSRRSYA
ncbi:hypothetical protein N8T08_003047 [Aspergillus melleus]|uniref:Uncharacterized protein n=1 Tax=Aspergillus melleus TaxID=138277 RepID=A0ACC3ALD5_9EURO|nr:hypothetical protein N8T08_003047 [Aspergillus melleus]